MPRPIPIHQEMVYYNAVWMKEVEHAMFRRLGVLANYGVWVPGWHDQNKVVLRTRVRTLLYAIYDEVNIPEEEVEQKYEEWHERYNNFKWLLSRRGVRHDENLNFVFASDASWETFVQERPAVAAYMLKGECNWHDLRPLFESLEDSPDSGVESE
ncbi:hypothetical protein C2S53_005621 [Perilla frutescens var. hirtella]|uniref:Uncharacterized protein n=1 Tax=Perilla frutescens var. hirtella TaxID=608512 RepID=A0AAD4PB19_PERFH|nr:hypothetical protein C2S53_005621 [Perilla frutescens var. hirtella]